MRRPVVIILGAAAGALLVAGIGASAHSAFTPTHLVVRTNAFGEAGTQTPEPTDTPEAAAAAEPTDAPEAASTAEPTEAPKAPTATEPADTDNETSDDATKTTTAPAPAQLDSGVMLGGGREKSGGGGHGA